MAQTTIQKQASIRFGSAKLEVGDDFLSLVNLGAIRGLSFNHKVETQTIPFDNTEEIKQFKNGQRASLTFQLAEFDLTTFGILDDGLVINSTIAGTLVSGATQTVTSGSWLEKNFIEIENQNGDGSAITVNSVTGATDGALVADDDYEVVKNGQGKYGIVLNLAGAALTTEAQNLTINYDYTPNASKKVTFNDFGTKTEKVARITNTNSSGDTFIMELTAVTNITPTVLPFVADDADDVAVVEIELDGYVSQILDSQSTT